MINKLILNIMTRKKKNKYVKLTTVDMFTGEKVYYYENISTREFIKSSNPNLLHELENTIRNTVPIEAMTFNFKIKKKTNERYFIQRRLL